MRTYFDFKRGIALVFGQAKAGIGGKVIRIKREDKPSMFLCNSLCTRREYVHVN